MRNWLNAGNIKNYFQGSVPSFLVVICALLLDQIMFICFYKLFACLFVDAPLPWKKILYLKIDRELRLKILQSKIMLKNSDLDTECFAV